jgi:hypothetical protein
MKEIITNPNNKSNEVKVVDPSVPHHHRIIVELVPLGRGCGSEQCMDKHAGTSMQPDLAYAKFDWMELKVPSADQRLPIESNSIEP